MGVERTPEDERGLVLVVEDSESTNHIVSLALGRDFRVVSAFDGVEGLSKALELAPDLILTDLAMPGLSGDELIRAVREVRALDAVPIVILSGALDEQRRDDLLRDGAQDYLTKPFSIDELRARVGNLLARRRAEQRNHALGRELDGARRAGQEEQRLRTWLECVIEQLPDAVVLTDAEGRVTLRSKAAAALGAGEHPVVLHDRAGEVIPFADHPTVRALCERHSVAKRELRVRADEGRLVPVLVGAVPVLGADGDVLGSATVIEDISPMKELERMREEWASIVAHDLRQPVTAIVLAADRLLRGAEPLPSARQQEAATRIAGAARRLNVMIGDLLDATCIESGRLCIDRRTGSLRKLITEAVADAGTASARCRVQLDDGADVTLSIDAGRVSQVLNNLLINAGKYGDPDRPITVSTRRLPGAVEVMVSNHGAELSDDERVRLFDRYQRGGAVRATLGLGLGLFICRGLVEGHGGRIWVECHEGQTHFHFTLPMPVPLPEAPSAGSNAAPR
ncbi:MAG: response regulator [Deltaproteobacteria bacterium]|nr:response regulator [Deltaproteobacteria bacterium]